MKVRHLPLFVFAFGASADEAVPPWTDPGDVPIPSWVKSVAPKKDDVTVYAAPGRLDQKRGTLHAGAVRLPIFGAKRAPDCTGRWFEIGPLAWVCSDLAEPSSDPPGAAPRLPSADGLPYRYLFAGKKGAWGFVDARHIEDDAPDFELDPGFVVATVGEQTFGSERFVRTRRGAWIRARDLVPARPSGFHGEPVTGGKLDFGWVVSERANVLDGITTRKVIGTRVRYEKIMVREERGGFVRISEDGQPAQWIAARDVAHPDKASPPPEARANERWIDVILASQTVVAYEGTEPVYATLMSSGRGAQGTDTATPRGTHRIWVKLETSDMDNLEVEDAEQRYSIEDVPYVQFFDRAVGLHAAFWHDAFGRVHSHGCVNLAPIDAAWFFRFTAPHLPAGWSAVLPTPLEPGTPVRVR